MVDILLTQSESKILLDMKKNSIDDNAISLPDLGGTLDIHLQEEAGKELFIVNYTRHSINLYKRNHHFRARKVIGIARLDLDGPPHRNPDGEEIGPRHLHLYREGYALRWAQEVPDSFSNLDDSFETLQDFLKYCNVDKMPNFMKGLFS